MISSRVFSDTSLAHIKFLAPQRMTITRYFKPNDRILHAVMISKRIDEDTLKDVNELVGKQKEDLLIHKD
jgi:hypothetical protein